MAAILLIDDMKGVRRAICAPLKRAGHSVTESVFWNSTGGGYLASWQYGWGYVIGTLDLTLFTGLGGIPFAAGTEPEASAARRVFRRGRAPRSGSASACAGMRRPR